MGCGESKHAVATENTLTKTKSKGKTMEVKPLHDSNEKVNENVAKNEEEFFKKSDEREGGEVKGVVNDHKNVELKSDGGAVAAVEKEEVKNQESKSDEAVVSNETSGQPEILNDSQVVPEEKPEKNDSPVVSEEKSESKNDSPVLVLSEQKPVLVLSEQKPENDSPVVSEQKSENDSPVVSEQKPENDSPVVFSEEKSEAKENNATEGEEKKEDVENKEKEEVVEVAVEETKSSEEEEKKSCAEEVVEAAVEETKSSEVENTASDKNENDKAAAPTAAADEKAN